MTEGGTLLQHKLGLASRATKDLDGIVRGDLDAFFEQMDEVLAENWGPSRSAGARWRRSAFGQSS